MNKFKYLLLLAVLIFGAASVNAQAAKADVAITLERTACFGSCPIYTVTILEDGTVLYNGEKFVDVTGEQTGQIDPATVAQMVQSFDEAGYFDWKEAYDEYTVSDLPTVITSVTRDGVTHRISRYLGDQSAPRLLPFLEQWIDIVANTGQWTGVQTNPSYGLGMDSPVITLQRDACFGLCPVYNVALFADGTVIYTGIANVDSLGVHVFKADPLEIEGLAQQAQALQYFTWEDSYQHMVKTDQATVTSSIQWEDEYKQIVRYDGDPNAPVGLVWIENSIDQLITRLTEA